jgi:hypothetical protein
VDLGLKLVILVGKLLLWLGKKLYQLLESLDARSENAPLTMLGEPVPPVRRVPPVAAPAPSPSREDTTALVRALDGLTARTAALGTTLEQQRSARRFLPAVSWATAELAVLRQRAAAGAALSDPLRRRRYLVEYALDEVDAMAADRRDARLAASLGDADALASACYQPIIDHARAEGLPLTVAEPAARWGDFDLSVMIGLVPTGVAPLFLPPDFFARIAWWPALAHEIGHNFLASVRGLDGGLRRALDLPGELDGRVPLDADAMTYAELYRVCGGWFEELFCDVFGTLMCGPAYVRTMTTLFAAEADPTSVAIVGEGDDGYQPHPPRHLRVIAGCRTLERAGLHADAGALRAEWEQRHRVDGEVIDRIVFPSLSSAYLSIPLPAVEAMIVSIVDRLHEGPFDALGGFGLADIPGLGYGPRAHAETRRAMDDLFAGRVPTVRDPRAVIAGAVLATHARPALEVRYLAAARAAIPALGTGEVRPGAYAPAAVTAPAGRRARAAELRDALILQAVLTRPPSTRRPLRRAR